jgi:uncharacterized membrane protein YkoI
MVPGLRLVAIVGALALVSGGALARPHERGEEPDPAIVVAQDFVALEDVLDEVRSRYPGHQLSVSGPRQAGGGYVYEIKWLTDEGAVLYIVVDAETGGILSVDGG